MRIRLALAGLLAIVVGLLGLARLTIGVWLVAIAYGLLLSTAAAKLRLVPVWAMAGAILAAIAGTAAGLKSSAYVPIDPFHGRMSYTYGYPFKWLYRGLGVVDRWWDADPWWLLADLIVWGSAGLIVLVTVQAVRLRFAQHRMSKQAL